MPENDFTYKSQDVNYLGFLEAQLRDLQGIDTLAYELIQNADDVRDASGRPQTTWLSFDVTDEALIVENDGVFRAVDFERLQNIAGGGKREEAGTTGAFGLGFIAVYQVTDAPEIFSNDRHWIIRPDAPADRRIQERQAQTDGTRFRLPWAFDEDSLVRRTLRIEAIAPRQLDDIAAAFAQAIELAALFLQQLQVLEVRRNGALLRRIERETAAAHQIVLHDSRGPASTWLLFHGEFADEAAALRAQYGWQIEAQRRSDVRLALPTAGRDGPGRLFAVLPTDSTLPAPIHINADFFPTTDRKRIHFDGGYQAAWNEAAITCAARTLAQNLPLLPERLGPHGLWQLIHSLDETRQMARSGLLPGIFTAFWQAVAPTLSETPVAYASDEAWRRPQEVRVVDHPEAIPVLEALHIPVVHPDLAPYYGLMRRQEVGARAVTIQDIVQALSQAGLTRPTPLHEAPAGMRGLDAWQKLWELLDTLLRRAAGPAEKATALEELGRCALVLSESMVLTRLDNVYRGAEEAKALFPDVAWQHPAIAPDAFPGRYVQTFGARQAVERLAEIPIDQLEEAWRMGRLDAPRLFRWFESHQIEIFADDPTLQQRIRRLPLVPVEGELRPLGDLYMPGGFEDPLRLAGMVDLQAIGGRREFLRDLGVRELDFDTYVHDYVPRLLAQEPDLPSDGLHRLVQLLAQRLGEIRDDDLLQDTLSQLPLIACLDGTFRPANEVYASRDAVTLLGEAVHVAEPTPSEAVSALHRWLGVRQEPTAADIVQTLLQTGRAWQDTALDERTMSIVQRRWQRLNTLLQQEQIGPEELLPLRDQSVIPNRGRHLSRPSDLFLEDREAERSDLVTRIRGIRQHLLPAEADYEEAAAAAGVRRLSEAVQLEVMTDGEGSVAADLQERIRSRRPLIERVLRAGAEAQKAQQQASFLASLRVLTVPRLRVRYRLPLDEKTLTTEGKSADAILETAGDNGAATLYVSTAPEPAPWAPIARELARGIRADRPTGSLALGIKEVLAAPTYEAAQQTLDELGYA